MLNIVRAIVASAVFTANAGLTARENGDRLAARRFQARCDRIAAIALRTATSYTRLGGDWESRPIQLLQGAESYSSGSMEGLVYLLD